MKIHLPMLMSRFSPNTNDKSDISEDRVAQRIVEIPRKYRATDSKTEPRFGDQADEEHSFAAECDWNMLEWKIWDSANTWMSMWEVKVVEVLEVIWI